MAEPCTDKPILPIDQSQQPTVSIPYIHRCSLVPHDGLMVLTVSVPMRLRVIDDPAHLPPLVLGQLNVPRRPVLLQPLGLGGAGNRDHALRRHPGQGDLRDGAALARRKLLDLIDDGAVLVEVVALEFGSCGGAPISVALDS